MTTLIKNGIIVTAAEQVPGDILIDKEKIVAIGQGLDDRAKSKVDAQGK